MSISPWPLILTTVKHSVEEILMEACVTLIKYIIRDKI